MPEFVAPEVGQLARAELAQRYPLVLTCAKPMVFCQTQHRALPALRKHALDPELELHPATAAARKITAGSWVALETPAGAMRARARLNEKLDPRVVVGEHGWWQGCDALGAGLRSLQSRRRQFQWHGRCHPTRSREWYPRAPGQSLRGTPGAAGTA